MPAAFLSIPASAEHVRTARMVAVAAARRAGLDDDTVEDVRLAVGEVVGRVVVGRAVVAYAESTVTSEIDLVLREGQGVFEVEVVDRGETTPRPPSDDADVELALALVRALVPEVRVIGPSVTLTWPCQQ